MTWDDFYRPIGDDDYAPKKVPCGVCDGSGYQKIFGWPLPCYNCMGTGKVEKND